MADGHPRVFLSYSAEDLAEVQVLAAELRRRGVPLWWDKTDLPRGQRTEKSLQEAADQAAGFAFYLTESAARSEWVREKERSYALQNAARDESFGIFPIFRDDLRSVREAMQAEAAGSDLDAYDLGRFHGYVVGTEPSGSGRAPGPGELATASGEVLRELLRTLRERSPTGSTLRIGACTRGGAALAAHSLDLLVDWTQDFPDEDGRGDLPNSTVVRELQDALASLRDAIRKEWRETRIRIIPQCHLTMAMALGFCFRRNTGITLEVLEPHAGVVWDGPHQPMSAMDDWWAEPAGTEEVLGKGDGLAVSIGISRGIAPIAKRLIDDRGLAVEKWLSFEPAAGASTSAMNGLTGPEAHQIAQTIIGAIARERASGVAGPVHLLFAGPAPFAVLLAQQLSNLGTIQTYEWKDGQRGYVPSFVLRSS